MINELSKEEFLNLKRDYSPLLVHLTSPCGKVPAKDILQKILREKSLKAFNHWCLFSPQLKKDSNPAHQERFKVICFTETPLDQIGVLLNPVKNKKTLSPYGLVFAKEKIRIHGGNPVFYVSIGTAKPLWTLYKDQSYEVCRLLALVNRFDDGMDFHWEREWRIVGSISFELHAVYCGLCPQSDIDAFEKEFAPIKFIDPSWGINRILDKLVGKLILPPPVVEIPF